MRNLDLLPKGCRPESPLEGPVWTDERPSRHLFATTEKRDLDLLPKGYRPELLLEGQE